MGTTRPTCLPGFKSWLPHVLAVRAGAKFLICQVGLRWLLGGFTETIGEVPKQSLAAGKPIKILVDVLILECRPGDSMWEVGRGDRG
jgi:hypothetical protein